MAIGDVTIKELLAKSLTTNSVDTQYTNGGATKQTVVTSIVLKLKEGSTTKRRVIVYKNGSGASNEYLGIDLDPNGTTSEVITQLDAVLTGTQTISVKQDVGTDVNVFINGIEEVIA